MHHFGKDDANRKCVGSGTVSCSSGTAISSLISIPADAQEVVMSSNEDIFTFTADGITNPVCLLPYTGIIVSKYGTAMVRGDNVIKDIRLDTNNKGVYIEFFSIAGAVDISNSPNK